MRKELGKWLMDIAKYITTAILLSAVFSGLQNPWMVISALVAVLITLGWGLWLVRDSKKKED